MSESDKKNDVMVTPAEICNHDTPDIIVSGKGQIIDPERGIIALQVESVYVKNNSSRGNGPAQVASNAYRNGYDAIFNQGKKEEKPN